MLLFTYHCNYMRPYLEARISCCDDICPMKGRTCGLPYTRTATTDAKCCENGECGDSKNTTVTPTAKHEGAGESGEPDIGVSSDKMKGED